jgi:hypothetical protein
MNCVNASLIAYLAAASLLTVTPGLAAQRSTPQARAIMWATAVSKGFTSS